MTNSTPGEVATPDFKAEPEHRPASDAEMYARVHFYTGALTHTIAKVLEETVKGIRRDADQLDEPELRLLAQKDYEVPQLIAANKEVVFNWMQQDLMEQGGEDAQEWLTNFLTIAAQAIENRYPEPPFKDVVPEYRFCITKGLFCHETAERVLLALGFGRNRAFIGPIEEKLEQSTARQDILKKSLTLPIEEIKEQSLW